MIAPIKLPKWKKSGYLTATRTFGKIILNKNGSDIDIWFWEGNKKVNWIAVNKEELLKFLQEEKCENRIFDAQSNSK
jgi:hypothetical protein